VVGTLCIAMLIILTPLASDASWSQQSCRSAHRIPVTVTAGTSGHNSETRINLASADFPANYVFSAAGEDVRVFESDDTTPVDFIVTGWDSVTRTGTLFVRLPAMAGSSSSLIYVYFGDSSLSDAGDATSVFPTPGVRLRSRVSTVDPPDAASALTAFDAATVDVHDNVLTTISGLNNRALGGANGNYGWCVSAVLEVTPATSGTWEFRYGGDFGRGGHLYIREEAVEEDWNDDLWWAGNYANTAETLEGSIALAPGWHRYEALGFEGCCDGATGFQARAPGGAWQDLSSSNFPLRGAQCIISTASISVGSPESCTTVLDASKDVTVVSDPLGNSSPYAVPGSVVRYDFNVTNPGQPIDAATLNLADSIPPNIAISVAAGSFTFNDGSPSSGLGFTYGGPGDMSDSVEFSVDGINFNYTPVPLGANDTDTNVTHVRFRPTGEFSPSIAGNDPNFIISFLAEVE